MEREIYLLSYCHIEELLHFWSSLHNYQNCYKRGRCLYLVAERADKAHRYLFLCVSQPERSVVSELSGPGLNRREGAGGSGQGNSFFLWPIVLPRFENTPTLFHPQLCTRRNRKRLHHSIHPSSLAKRPVTIIDFSLSLLTTSNTSESER